MVKWQINLIGKSHSTDLKPIDVLPEPFGYSRDATQTVADPAKRKKTLNDKLWQLATASKSQIFMTVFMFWMMGNNISIFILFAIFQSLMSCVGGLVKMNKVFEPYEHLVDDLSYYKLMYTAINLVLLGIIIYKLSAMGLLPVSPTDYVDLIAPYQATHVIMQSNF